MNAPPRAKAVRRSAEERELYMKQLEDYEIKKAKKLEAQKKAISAQERKRAPSKDALREQRIAKVAEEKMEASIRRAFDRFDLDGSGEIDNYEFKKVCEMLGGGVPDAELDKFMFRNYGKNDDQTIRFDEFKEWWKTR